MDVIRKRGNRWKSSSDFIYEEGIFKGFFDYVEFGFDVRFDFWNSKNTFSDFLMIATLLYFKSDIESELNIVENPSEHILGQHTSLYPEES